MTTRPYVVTATVRGATGVWHLRWDPPPIPGWQHHQWSYVHDDYDPPDNRCGQAATIEDCLTEIEEIEAELADG